MANIFKLRGRRSPPPDPSADPSTRLEGESRQAVENDTRRRASERAAVQQAAENETRRHAADDETRRQAGENEMRRRASEGDARRQADENEARHRSADGRGADERSD